MTDNSTSIVEIATFCMEVKRVCYKLVSLSNRMTNLLYKDILLIIDKDTVLFLCLFRNPKKKNYPQSYDLWKATRLKKPPGLWEKPPHLQQYI